MKSLLLLFFMIPTAVCAMSMDFEEFPESFPNDNNDNNSFWLAGKWGYVDKLTDKIRQNTLTVIQKELTTTSQKIQNCSSLLPNDRMNAVNDQLNKWLSAITNSLVRLNSPGERIAIDAAIKAYANQEKSIGNAVTNLEQALQFGNSSNSVDALQALMSSLLVSPPEEELPFDNLSLN